MYGAGLLTIVLTLSATVSAGNPVAVPEIGGSSLITGLGLLTGSLMILKARWRSK